MRASHRRVVALAAAAGLVVGLSGCGDGSTPRAGARAATTPTVGAVFSQAQRSVLSASTAHLSGWVVKSGQRLTLDIAGRVDGTNQTLQMSLGTSGSMTALTVGGAIYVKGDKTFWDSSAGAGSGDRIGDKYVILTGSDATDIGSVTMKDLLTGMFSDSSLSALKAVTSQVRRATVDGQDAYVLTDTRAGTGSSSGELDVTTDGTARLIAVRTVGSEQGEVHFTDWGAVGPVLAPPPAEVLAS